MWMQDIIEVLIDLQTNWYGKYGCCVGSIENNIITMTNGDKWFITSQELKRIK